MNNNPESEDHEKIENNNKNKNKKNKKISPFVGLERVHQKKKRNQKIINKIQNNKDKK